MTFPIPGGAVFLRARQLQLGGVDTDNYVSGQYLCTPTQYAPGGGQIGIVTSSATMASLSAAATTVASGSNGGEISTVASWAHPSAGVLDVANTAGWPSAGTVHVAATGPTTAVVTYTGVTATSLTGCAYVSGSPTGTVATGGAVTVAVAGASSAVPAINTGPFTAPPSGSVIVSAAFIGQPASSGDAVAFGLCAHGTLTPMIGAVQVWKDPATTQPYPHVLEWLITGLTAGSSYNFDLMFASASASAYTVFAYLQSATSPTLSNTGVGGPVQMTVQAV